MVTARRRQRTIAKKAEVHGVGFVKGSDVSLKFHPSHADTGVVFVRTDLPGRPAVRARIDNVVSSQRRTTIQQGEARVEMVEHVMAALAGLQIDNCLIEIDAFETPGCDGSSKAFTEALAEAGSQELDRPREVLVLDKPVTVREGAAVMTAYPGDGTGYVLSYHLDYGKTPIGAQSLFLDVNPESFLSELAPSRTFLLEAEAHSLKQAGIGPRATESDLLIFGPEGVIGNELRYSDECVRHKILDMVGDLALLEKDIVGHVVAHRSGHQLNAALVRELVVDESSKGPMTAAKPAQAACSLEIAQIMKILPHRYPFLLVDRVLEIESGKRILAVKNVSANEPFFQGHWPGRPVMPGVLILEAMAQAAGIMISKHVERPRKITMIAAIDDVKLRRPVVPGDQLLLELFCTRLKSTSAQIQGVARVGDAIAAEAKMMFVMVDAEPPAA